MGNIIERLLTELVIKYKEWFPEYQEQTSYAANPNLSKKYKKVLVTVIMLSLIPYLIYLLLFDSGSDDYDVLETRISWVTVLMIIAVIMIIVFMVVRYVNGKGDGKKKLMNVGNKIEATIVDVVKDSENVYSMVPEYYFYCVYDEPHNGKKYAFKSELIETEIDMSKISPIGLKVPVYYQPSNYDNYYVHITLDQNTLNQISMLPINNVNVKEHIMSNDSVTGNKIIDYTI